MMKQHDVHDILGCTPQQAWIVFTNQADLPWLGMLREGFRHCFVLIHDGEHWISVDPMANYMEVVVHNVPAHFDLCAWLQERGHHVIEAELTQSIKRSAPIMLFTCVEACKRILGIHKRSILTPWQLYRHLEAQRQEQAHLQHTEIHKGEYAWEA